ncbi:hypothetical protein ACJRO7_010536 [Eucalyptus globulus]|uniref:Uncharacterized protein n=1 Tax=Eucalyptus globulus TaxID=34317 RepID=A0ABD3LFR1_EUCGL
MSDMEDCCDLQLCLDEIPSTFNLEKAVCNHGFFMMAPNSWIPSTKTLRRPLRLADFSSSVVVSISQPPGPSSTVLLLRVHREQVIRMLRLSGRDERNVKEFHKVHPEAKDRGFGRVFRSPSLFEDVVKSLLLCNFQLSSKRKKRRQEKDGANPVPAEMEGEEVDLGNFPSPKELANLDADYLQSKCKLGYRTNYILKLAMEIEEGKLKIDGYEGVQDAASCRILIKGISGVGSFARASVLMCLGFYDEVPWDSETIKFLKHVHARQGCTKKTIKSDLKEIYDKYLLEFYERQFGKLSELSHTMYHKVSSSTQMREFNHNHVL